MGTREKPRKPVRTRSCVTPLAVVAMPYPARMEGAFTALLERMPLRAILMKALPSSTVRKTV